MPIDYCSIGVGDKVAFHIAICDVDVVWQIAQWILENIAVWAQVHLKSCACLHTILDDCHWAQSIATTFSIQLGVVISSLDIDCGLPWQENLVVMVHPSACDISVPIFNIELSICHTHRTQIFLNT